MIVYKPIAKISAMTFDLDDTLYDNWPYISEAEIGLHQYISQHYPAAAKYERTDWQRFKREILHKDASLYSDMGQLRRETLTLGLKIAGYEGNELINAVQDCYDWFYYQRSNFTVDRLIIDILDKLACKYPLIAITNGNVNLDQIGISHCFIDCFKANVNRPMKPHPHMFNQAVKQFNVPAEQVLHVGDNLEKDVWGATQAGLGSAWYAINRSMDIRKEPVMTLPNFQIESLSELLHI